MKYELYTDGSIASRGVSLGGWAFCVVEPEEGVVYEEYGSENGVTISRMEVMAVLRGIEWASKNLTLCSKLGIYSDSKYVVDSCNIWMHNWDKNGWVKHDPKIGKVVERPHSDLFKSIKEIKDLNKGKYNFNWVKSHNGNKYNEYVDKLAYNAYRIK